MCDVGVSTDPPNLGYSFKVAGYSAVKPSKFNSNLDWIGTEPDAYKCNS